MLLDFLLLYFMSTCNFLSIFIVHGVLSLEFFYVVLVPLHLFYRRK
jgi:hypothetical protein